MRHTLHVERCGDHVHIDVSSLPAELRPILAAALEPLAKAGGSEAEDPRFPELGILAARVRASWERWTSLLARSLGRFLVSPSEADPAEVEKEFGRFEVGVLADTTGYTADRATVRELVDAGELPASYATTAPIPTAVRIGFTAPTVLPARPRDPLPDPPDRELSSAELGAVAYARERAAIYMRRPIGTTAAAGRRALLDAGKPGDRSLSAHERSIVAGVIGSAVRDRTGVQRVAQQLRDAVAGTQLSNDMGRVARTELAFAHHAGALVSLRATVPTGQDPLVYKTISPGACRECRRIWGNPKNPNLHRLSVVMAGDNFARPAATWGPTIGPTHPNCTCPPIQVWDAAVHDAVQDVAAELARVFGDA